MTSPDSWFFRRPPPPRWWAWLLLLLGLLLLAAGVWWHFGRNIARIEGQLRVGSTALPITR